MRHLKWALAALAALAIPASGQSPAQLQPNASNKTVLAPAPMPSTSSPGTAAPQLTKADVDAWLDGFAPYALKSGGIPGMVVVVVKDGQPLTMRGFGYSDVKAAKPVDPNLTLFRPGSVSKLFTWTAVMQQVQAGKLDLDKDVNTYLDFKIPPRSGKPITLRNLMSHTGGFAETAKYLINERDEQPKSLDKVLKNWIPDRIYEAGEIPAYSNYGASLAGYIVERVSGEPFNQYVQRHIFAPLGMSHSTFDQPLPASLRPLMSKGYLFGSDKPGGYEVIALAPAGSLASTGADMAKFMIAHLSNGGTLLNPATSQLMHAQGNRPFSALPSMALGFYHEDRNGLNIIGHAGDLTYFHSDLHLYLDKNVGLFMSVNSPGKAGAAHVLREQLFHDFTNRYYPAPAQNLPTLNTAKAHGETLSGHYVSSRAGGFTFMRMLTLLGETSVGVDKDANLIVSSVTDPSGQPRSWREVAPWIWQEVGGTDRLQAVLDSNGKVKMFSITPFAAIIEFVPAPLSLNSGWILPLAGLALAVMVLAALSWPITALTRRRYKVARKLHGRPLLLRRITYATGWLFIALIVGWMLILTFLQKDLTLLDDRLDIWMRMLQLILVLAIVGAVAAVWNAYTVVRTPGRHRTATIWAVAVALAAAFLIWVSLDAGLLTTSLNY
jgi:CubicO group peptidase (beta-lactamase class C family)